MSKSLQWKQTGRLRSKLYSGSTEAASLTWANWHTSLATGVVKDESWTFKRAGFLRPRVTVRNSESSSIDQAVLTMGWGVDGTIVFSDGESYSLKHKGFLRPSWSVLDSKGEVLISLKPKVGFKTVQCDVDVVADASRTLLLATLAWYVILLTLSVDSDVSGSTAAVMAATGA